MALFEVLLVSFTYIAVTIRIYMYISSHPVYISVTTSSGCAAFFQQASSGPDRCISIAAYSGTTAAAQLPSSSPAPPAVVQPFSSRLEAVQPGVFLLQPTAAAQQLSSPSSGNAAFSSGSSALFISVTASSGNSAFFSSSSAVTAVGIFSGPSALLSALKRTYSVNAVAQR